MDLRGHAALDGGSKTRLPPLVRREMTAFLTTSDAVRNEARRKGAGVGPLALVRSRDNERNGRDRICPWPLLWTICGVWEAHPGHGQRGLSLAFPPIDVRGRILISTKGPACKLY